MNSWGSRIDDCLLDLAIEHEEVALEAESGGALEALGVVADEEAAEDEIAGSVLGDDGLDVDDGQVRGEVLAGVVEDAADGRLGAAHHALHAVDGAEEVGAVDADGAAGADEDVLVAVGHADDLVRNDLADGEDEVVAAFSKRAC